MRNATLTGLAFALLTASCGGDPTAPPDKGVLRFSLVAADAPLTGTVGAMLPVQLEVQAKMSLSGDPVPGQVVSFVVVEPNCGRAFAGTATTNDAGSAREQWELGTKAGTCTMEVRAVDQVTGAPMVLGTFAAVVEPGVTTEAELVGNASPLGGLVASKIVVPAGGTAPLASFVGYSADRYGNRTPRAPVTGTILSGTATVAGGVLQAGPDETTGELRLQVGEVTWTVPYSVGVDLRAHRWAASYACAFRPGVRMETPSGARADSVRFELTVDSVTYTSPQPGMVAKVWASGPGTFHLASGGTEALPEARVDVGVWDQSPGSIWFTGLYARWAPGNMPAAAGPSLRQPADPTTYEGGTWCRTTDWLNTTPMTFTQLVP